MLGSAMVEKSKERGTETMRSRRRKEKEGKRETEGASRNEIGRESLEP